MFAVSAALGVFGVFFLQMRGIGEQDVAQLDGRRVGVDRAMKSVAHEPRQIAGVVQVRVRQHAPIERRGFFRKRIPVAQAQFLQPLEQAAIHQQPFAFGFHQIFRARNGSGRAKKCEFRHRVDILMEVSVSRAGKGKRNNTEDTEKNTEGAEKNYATHWDLHLQCPTILRTHWLRGTLSGSRERRSPDRRFC